MKRTFIYTLLFLSLTACQPAAAVPTNTQVPATTPVETEQQGYQPSRIHVVINELIIEDGECCISALVGESLVLHIDLESFEMQKTPEEMRIISTYTPFKNNGSDTPVWRAELQPFEPFTQMTFEVLPNWNEIEICVQVTRIDSKDVDADCTGIAVFGESPGTESAMAHIDPQELRPGMQLTLPGWLADPQYHVFAVLWEQLDERYAITFYKVETQERFDLVVAETAAYFWTPDGKHFGLLEQFGKRVHLIDISDGTVSTYPIGKHAIKPLLNSPNKIYRFESFPDPVPGPLFANSSDPANAAFQLAYDAAYWETPYTVSIGSWDEHDKFTSGVVVKNHATGESYVLTDPQDGNANLDVDFSPINKQIALVQGVAIGGMGQTGDHLLIYSAETGEKLAEYEGLYFQVRWSPNGEEILYTTLQPRQEGISIPDISPCILTVATGTSRCLTDIGTRFENTEAFL